MIPAVDAALRIIAAILELQVQRYKLGNPADVAAMVAREERWLALCDKVIARLMPDLFPS